MSIYWIIDSIKNANTIEALEVVEKWINELRTTRFVNMLCEMALIKKCELLTKRYCEE